MELSIPRGEVSHEVKAAEIRRYILTVAVGMLGMPGILYKGREHGMTPDGFDCSGYVMYVLRAAQEVYPELVVPDNLRQTPELFDYLGSFVHTPLQKPGDLVFFSKEGHRPSHVGIYFFTDEQGDWYIQSPGNDDTKVMMKPYRSSAIDASRSGAIYTHNPIGYKRLKVKTGNPRWPERPL